MFLNVDVVLADEDNGLLIRLYVWNNKAWLTRLPTNIRVNTRQYLRDIVVYTTLASNFHTLYKIPDNNICIYDGNSDSIATNYISFQIHKRPGRVTSHQGICCCSGQSASENFAKLPNTKCWVECSIVWRSRLLRHTFLDEIRSGLPLL